MIVISDTTPIISLLKGKQLELLQKLYNTVLMPQALRNLRKMQIY